MAVQGRFFESFPFASADGKPDSIYAFSSFGTHGCCAGVSRAMRNQMPPAMRPNNALTQNDHRQPYCTSTYVMRGGARPAPKPTPVKMMPFAIPRSVEGIQADTMQFEAG